MATRMINIDTVMDEMFALLRDLPVDQRRAAFYRLSATVQESADQLDGIIDRAAFDRTLAELRDAGRTAVLGGVAGHA